MADDPEETFVVVDENDDPIRFEKRSVVHRYGLRHRSVHVLLVNSAGDVLVQLRSKEKDEYPFHWDVSVGGHVAPEETYEQAAHRELQEELGLKGETVFLRKTPACEETGWEFNCLYMVKSDEAPKPNPDEIVRCEFVVPVRLVNEIDSGERKATPALRNALGFYVGEETGF